MLETASNSGHTHETDRHKAEGTREEGEGRKAPTVVIFLNTQNRDSEVADLMPLTAKGQECFIRAQVMLVVSHHSEFTDKLSE